MTTLVLICFLLFMTCGAITLQKTYSKIPLREMKRRARHGDSYDTLVYRVASFGVSVRVLLWFFIAVGLSAIFYTVSRMLPWPIAVVGIIAVLWVGFVWLPYSRVSGWSRWLVKFASPIIVWILNYLHPILERFGFFMQRRVGHVAHTHMYEKADLIALLEQQAHQTDNRIDKAELTIARHALQFGEKLVRDIMIPRSQVAMVKPSDVIGPVLMDELHAKGHSRYPVFIEETDTIVGVLYVHDLIKKQHGGTVEQIMQPEVHYAHEEQTLYQTLNAFLKTKRHLFVVVNGFEEVTGIVTIEDVLEQIIGSPIVDEFDQYEDLRAVAARQAHKLHTSQKHETVISPETPEVVE